MKNDFHTWREIGGTLGDIFWFILFVCLAQALLPQIPKWLWK